MHDEPRPGEKLYAYQLADKPGGCFMDPGGFYPVATYRVIEPQPSPEEMATTIAWIKWVEANKHIAIVKP